MFNILSFAVLKKMNCNFLKNSLHIDINGNVFPCTVSSSVSAACIGNINNNTLEDIYNSRHIDTLCKDFCSRCTRYSHSFKNFNLSDEDYYFLDIRLDNICNFMCRMCGGDNSIAFRTEDENVKSKSIASVLFKNIDFINKFKKIYIGGGEPFLSPSFLKFLQLLSENKTIMISSNFSNIKIDILDELKRFKKVIFYPSIDGIDEVGEYIRYGFKTSAFFDNFNVVTKKFECIPVVTVSALNLLTLDKLILKLEEVIDINSIYLNILDYPSEFSITTLPSYLKLLYQTRIKKIKNKLNKYFHVEAPYNTYYGLENIDMMLSNSNSLDFNKMKSTLSKLDKIRMQDFSVLFGGKI